MIDWTRMRSAADIAAEADAARRAEITAAVDAHVDAAARARGYAGAAQLASYAASTVADWAAEAQAYISWRDAVWLAAIPLIDSGTSLEMVMAALPVFKAAK